MDSAKNVESNDHLLTEILVHLPPKTLFKFMIVSRRWKHLIADPFFHKRHHNKQRRSSSTAAAAGDRLLALFQLTTKHLSRRYPRPLSEHPMNILAVIPGANPKIRHVERELGYFINSSGGLVLCGHHPSTYYVINPVTNKWVHLPPPPRNEQYREWTIGLMMTTCEDNSYIVVRAALTFNLGKHLPIETYSSRTGEWVPSTLLGTDTFILFFGPEPPMVSNGVFHWYTRSLQIAMYDPSGKSGSHMQLIETPIQEHAVSRAITRSSVDDTLWFGTIDPDKILIFMLPKGDDGTYNRETTIPQDEWKLVHDINIASLSVFFHVPDPMSDPKNRIRLECFVPNWNPLVVVLRQAERIFLYDLGSNIVEPVRYHGRPYNHVLHDDCLCPYLESSCLSSYFF